MKQQSRDRHMSPHSDTLSWFRANQSLLFLRNVACLAEKQQPDQGEKLVPNTFIMFVFLFTELNSVQIHTPTCFPGSDDCWIFIKKIVSKLNGKFDSVITWPFDITSRMMFVVLHFFNLSYFSQIYIGKDVPILSNHSL